MARGADTVSRSSQRSQARPDAVRISLEVRPREAVVAALSIAAVLSVLSLVAHLPHGSTNLLRVLSADDERSLPTFWSCLQLVVVAGLTALVWQRATHDRRAWAVAAAGVLLLALDEAVSLHESMIEPLRQVLDPSSSYPLLTFAWVVPGAAAVLLIGVASLGFLRRMESRLRRDLLVAVGVFLLGALVLEAISGAFFSETSVSATYVLVMTAEELCEMVGVALAGGALLRHLLRQQSARRVVKGLSVVSTAVDAPRRSSGAAASS